MTTHKKHGLGRGLGAIIAGAKPRPAAEPASAPSQPAVAGAQTANAPAEAKPPATPFFEIPVSRIDASPHQARREFDVEALRELADSIRSEGLLQPLVVRRKGDRYVLIAGERRLRAVRQLGLKAVYACVLEAGDQSSAVMGLIENLQRRDLNPIETALGIASLMKDFGLTQEAVAERIGMPRASVANTLRLLSLECEIQNFIVKGTLSVGHAKVLLGLDDSDERLLVARKAIAENMSVREIEVEVMRMKRDAGKRMTRNTPKQAADAVIADLERRISSALNTRVTLKHGVKQGKLIIEYFGNEDLQRILEILKIS